jgi:hypothetical protein
MKLFKYNQFLNESNQDIDSICQKYGIKNYNINQDGTIDVNGGVDLSYEKLTELPLKFRNVSGNFLCHYNELTSLEGSPISVGGCFYCYNNQLATLEGSPQSVGDDFDCSHNQLISLKGSPQSLSGDFYCSYNRLTTLEGAPQSVFCFDCQYNKLRDVYGIKQGFKLGSFFIDANPVYEIFKLFEGEIPEDRWIEVIELLNEYGVIRDGNKVILQALEMVFEEMDLDCPQIEYINGYEII